MRPFELFESSRRLVGLSVALFCSIGFAQGFELDLSEPEVPPEFRPTLAVIGISSGEAAEDPIVTSRAKMLEAELVRIAAANPAFGKVMDPGQAAQELGAKAAEARKCIDFACLDTLAKALKVDRLILGTVTKSGPASMLTLYGFDAVLPEVVQGTVESGEKAEKAKIGGFAGIQGAEGQGVRQRRRAGVHRGARQDQGEQRQDRHRQR
jgi:hypothetical protein